MKKIITVNREKVINNFLSEDGELLDSSIDIKAQKIYVGKETFALIFSEIIKILSGLGSIEKDILIWCSQNCLIDTNVINLGVGYREFICKEFGLKDQSVKNAISNLVKKGILLRKGGGVYIVHPKYFWRGDMGKRKQYILELNLDM